MIATQPRETIIISVDPSITAKAAGLAAKAGNKTTANVLEEWLTQAALEMELEDQSTEEAAK